MQKSGKSFSGAGIQTSMANEDSTSAPTTSSPSSVDNFGVTAAPPRSFKQKRGMVRESFGPKYPDSERGETRARASFLVDNTLLPLASAPSAAPAPALGGNQSPTERTFSKTPRATLFAEQDPAVSASTPRSLARESNFKKSVHIAADNNANNTEQTGTGNAAPSSGAPSGRFQKKKSMFISNLFSKQRNKK